MVNSITERQEKPLIAYICLGSNVGKSEEILGKAVEDIDGAHGLSVLSKSSIYKTEPQGLKEQAWFYNQVIAVTCSPNVTAHALMDFLLQVEANYGRERSQPRRNAPRSLDLDLLLFGQETSTDTHCILPHARMFERAFVLIPLREIITAYALDFLQTEHSHDYIDKKLTELNYSVQDDKIFQH